MASKRRVFYWHCIFFLIIHSYFVQCEQRLPGRDALNSQNIDNHGGRNQVAHDGSNLKVKQADNRDPPPVVVQQHSQQGAVPAGGGLPLKRDPRVNDNPNRHPPAHPSKFRIADHPSCVSEVSQFCPRTKTNNFAVLDCLQSDEKNFDKIGPKCQNLLWEYKRNLTLDNRFEYAAWEVCKTTLDMSEFAECKQEKAPGHVVSCLVGLKANVTDKNCQLFLNKMASIIFSDYRLLSPFIDQCKTDIVKMNCGRLESDTDAPHKQGFTIGCLDKDFNNLKEECQTAMLRIAELQASDYHMDRPLYYACRDDREEFCKNVQAGDGRIYKCLYKHKMNPEMSPECLDKLTARQKLIQEDYKVSYTFLDTCRNDIRAFGCNRRHESQPAFKQGRMAVVLLCLEYSMGQDAAAGHQVNPKCLREMKDWRTSLMQDYQISPDIVQGCHKEITETCKGLQRNGKTLHCLMELARPSKHKFKEDDDTQEFISSKCKAALSDLVEEVDPGSDFTVDPAIVEACGDVASRLCKDVQHGTGEGLACLMDNLDNKEMDEECEDRLLEVQYFISRDFKLDKKLFRQCRKDAVELGCAKKDDFSKKQVPSVEMGPVVLTCLQRNAREKSYLMTVFHHWWHFYQSLKLWRIEGVTSGKTQSCDMTETEYTEYTSEMFSKKNLKSRSCGAEIRRVMRERTANIDLEPDIELPCMKDLARFCSDTEHIDEKGGEMDCLEDHLDELSEQCKAKVGEFVGDADEDPLLDRLLMKACMPMLERFCKEEMKGDTEPDEIMECLIEHKHDGDMDEKCTCGIEHHQLITAKDFHFSHKFKLACKEPASKLCKEQTKKADVVYCLSEAVFNDTLLDTKQRVPQECRKQLRFELLTESEVAELDPGLAKNCAEDMKRLCGNVIKENGEMEHCLKKHQKELTDNCHVHIFKREKVEMAVAGGDYTLMHTCKNMIKLHCAHEDSAGMLICLKTFMNTPGFDMKCKKMVDEKLVLQHKDFRLNPELHKACRLDVPKFCKAVLSKHMSRAGNSPVMKELEGVVIECLKKEYVKKNNRLSPACHDQIGIVMHDAQLDYKKDPVLGEKCKTEIRTLCADSLKQVEDGHEDQGLVEECLKENIQNIKPDSQCLFEVIRLFIEGRADVHVDPHLNQACSIDLEHYCKDVPKGLGRKMSCLLSALDDTAVRLTPDCKRELGKRRELWSYAAKVAPEGMSDIANMILDSPAKNSFIGLAFALIAVILILGLFCGRVTKRVPASVKNK